MMKKKSDKASQQKKKHKGKSQGGIGPGRSIEGPKDACRRTNEPGVYFEWKKIMPKKQPKKSLKEEKKPV